MANLDQLNEARIHQALIFLAETDIKDAELSGQEKELSEGLKSVKSALYLDATGTDGVRKAMAEASEVYSANVREWVECWTKWKTLNNQRQHEIRLIDLFRTLEASRRKGNII
jgi:hypothetical protein